jgi:CHAD domain-containing protein
VGVTAGSEAPKGSESSEPAVTPSDLNAEAPDASVTHESTIEGAPGPKPPERPSIGDAPGPINVSDSPATAARKAMWTHVDRLLAREPTALDPEHPDDLRKYRVAVRRLRAAARLFRDAIASREMRPIRRDLSGLAEAIGIVRDLDLRVADLARWSGERGEASVAAVRPLADTWAGERARAAAALAAQIQTRRHHRLIVRLVDLVNPPPGAERDDDDVAYSIGDRTASRLWAAYEDVRAYARVVRWADLETLHELRIAAKRLRDSLDLLGDILGPERGWLAERLVALQDHLGTTNDVAVTGRAVRTFLEDRHQRLAQAERVEIAAYLTDRERAGAPVSYKQHRPHHKRSKHV